jgi:hypothetical protein
MDLNYRLPLEDSQEFIDPKGLKFYEFDVYIPQYAMAFEYQGETHYFTTHIFGRASERQLADQIKRKYARAKGITLIPVPFWWDKSSSTLAATIRYYRPDFAFPAIPPAEPRIAVKIPVEANKPFHYIPKFPTDYNEQTDPTGWYVISLHF